MSGSLSLEVPLSIDEAIYHAITASPRWTPRIRKSAFAQAAGFGPNYGDGGSRGCTPDTRHEALFTRCESLYASSPGRKACLDIMPRAQLVRKGVASAVDDVNPPNPRGNETLSHHEPQHSPPRAPAPLVATLAVALSDSRLVCSTYLRLCRTGGCREDLCWCCPTA
jgi:hypothetical protein